MHKTWASVYFSSKTSLFIDRPHLVTCHNIHRSETKLTFKALSLTYNCRGRVGPGGPRLLSSLWTSCCKTLRGEQPSGYCSHFLLTHFLQTTHTHLESWQTGEGHPEQVMHTSSALCAEMRRGSFRVWSPPRLVASDRKQRRTRRKLLSSTKYLTSIFYLSGCTLVGVNA